MIGFCLACSSCQIDFVVFACSGGGGNSGCCFAVSMVTLKVLSTAIVIVWWWWWALIVGYINIGRWICVCLLCMIGLRKCICNLLFDACVYKKK